MEEVGCESPLRSIAQSPSASPGRVELKRTLRSCLMCLSSPVQASVHFLLPFHLCRVVNSPATSSLTATSWPLPQLHFGPQLLNPPLPSWISPHPLLSASHCPPAAPTPCSLPTLPLYSQERCRQNLHTLCISASLCFLFPCWRLFPVLGPA